MARGDLVVFDVFTKYLGQEVFAFPGDSLYLALIDNTTPPTAADLTPTWGDYSANEVTGTNYTPGGYLLTGVTWTESSGTSTLDDTGNVTWTVHASGPPDVYFGILYDDTAASDEAICYLDMGGPVSLADGNIVVTWGATGIAIVAKA
jgi:hypothetical protein